MKFEAIPWKHLVVLVLSLCHFITGDEETSRETKIVGGVEARRNEFPWLIRIQRKQSKSLLLSSAAHCLFKSNPNDYEVVAGDHIININEGTEQTRNIKKAILHKSYNSNTYTDDICILKLSISLNITAAVNLIPLPALGYNQTANSTVAGWGLRLEGANYSENILRKVNLPAVSNSVCSAQYTGISVITNKMLCAGISGKDSCQGDSGGPLMCTNGNVTVACGIVSFGVGCGKPGYAGVYTRVSEYRDWINTAEYSSGNGNTNNRKGFQIIPNLAMFVFLLVLAVNPFSSNLIQN